MRGVTKAGRAAACASQSGARRSIRSVVAAPSPERPLEPGEVERERAEHLRPVAAGPHPQAVHVELELTHRLGTSTIGPYPDLPLRCRCRVWERRRMSPRRTATLATLLALALSAALAGPALAVPVAIPGAPLTVYVDELGQLQAKRDTQERNIFYRSTSTTGDAGFFLAFPDAAPRPS